VGPYELGVTLGQGAFGKVKLGTNIFSGEKVAIKIICHSANRQPKEIQQLEREKNILLKLNHPNIVNLNKVVEDPARNKSYMIFEYVNGGELFDYIVNHGRLSEVDARKFMRQIISAVEYCHSLLIIHRDLKPENLLLDDQLNIKITDFGLSNIMEPGKRFKTFCGSLHYASPEILRGKEYLGPGVDIWAMGIILYCLVVGRQPWDGANAEELISAILDEGLEIPDSISDDCVNLILAMLRVKEDDRIPISQMRHHRWIMVGYDHPPPSYLPTVAPVEVIDDSIIKQMESMGLVSGDGLQTLLQKLKSGDKENQASCVYHLLAQQKAEAAEKLRKEREKERAQEKKERTRTPPAEEETKRFRSQSMSAKLPLPEPRTLEKSKERARAAAERAQAESNNNNHSGTHSSEGGRSHDSRSSEGRSGLSKSQDHNPISSSSKDKERTDVNGSEGEQSSSSRDFKSSGGIPVPIPGSPARKGQRDRKKIVVSSPGKSPSPLMLDELNHSPDDNRSFSQSVGTEGGGSPRDHTLKSPRSSPRKKGSDRPTSPPKDRPRDVKHLSSSADRDLRRASPTKPAIRSLASSAGTNRDRSSSAPNRARSSSTTPTKVSQGLGQEPRISMNPSPTRDRSSQTPRPLLSLADISSGKLKASSGDVRPKSARTGFSSPRSRPGMNNLFEGPIDPGSPKSEPKEEEEKASTPSQLKTKLLSNLNSSMLRKEVESTLTTSGISYKKKGDSTYKCKTIHDGNSITFSIEIIKVGGGRGLKVKRIEGAGFGYKVIHDQLVQQLRLNAPSEEKQLVFEYQM